MSVHRPVVASRDPAQDAPGQATFVWNMGYHAKGAAEEIDRLFRELFPEIAAESFGESQRIQINHKP